MGAFKTILVPVDFSDCSTAALERAACLARKAGATIHVLHCWEVPESVPADDAQYANRETIQSFADTSLADLIAKLHEKGIGAERFSIERGAPAKTIVEIASKGRYDLVVMGTHGRTGLDRALLGSVAEKVVRCAPCPVLCLRGAAELRDPVRKILVPVDYSEGSAHALECATSIAEWLGAELEVVHVWDRPAYVSTEVLVRMPEGSLRPLGELIRLNAEAEMATFLANHLRRNEGSTVLPPHYLISGEPAASLVAELERGRHDLVVVGTHGRTGLKHLLLGSVADKLVRFAPVPVLTVPRRS
jgi:nucleotide-binding universal stress UspA family protein